MRRIGGLFPRVFAYENLLRAAQQAQRGKRYRRDVLRFNLRQEDELHLLGRELREGRWQPEVHRHFLIHEPKKRWISAASYRDRVVHHALCNVIEPVLDARLVYDCWANRRGKGSHRAVLRYQRFAGRYRYALKVDIRQYFASIDHSILKALLERVFKGHELLDLMGRIIDGGNVPEPHDAYFSGDDLFTPKGRRKGLPIGNLTSQVWANTYLGEFDHWVRQELGAPGFVRFVDDFILLHDDKSVVAEWRVAVRDRLAELRLQPHERKTVIRRTDEGVPFLGYMVWPNRIRVRGETVRRFRRRLTVDSEQSAQTRERRLAAWRGHVELAGGWRRRTVL